MYTISSYVFEKDNVEVTTKLTDSTLITLSYHVTDDPEYPYEWHIKESSLGIGNTGYDWLDITFISEVKDCLEFFRESIVVDFKEKKLLKSVLEPL